jgi:hypothetical protein
VGNIFVISILGIALLLVFYLPIPWTVSSEVFINMDSNILYIPLHDNKLLYDNPKTSVEIDALYTINNKPIELILTFTGDTVVYKSHLYVVKKFECDTHKINVKFFGNELLKANIYI